MDNKRELEIHLCLTQEGDVVIPGVIVIGVSNIKRKNSGLGRRAKHLNIPRDRKNL